MFWHVGHWTTWSESWQAHQPHGASILGPDVPHNKDSVKHHKAQNMNLTYFTRHILSNECHCFHGTYNLVNGMFLRFTISKTLYSVWWKALLSECVDHPLFCPVVTFVQQVVWSLCWLVRKQTNSRSRSRLPTSYHKCSL